jgi:hypothetical protein
MGEPNCRESGVGAQLVVTLCRDGRAGRREDVRRTVGLFSREWAASADTGTPVPHARVFFGGGEMATGCRVEPRMERKKGTSDQEELVDQRRLAEPFGWIFDRAGSLRLLVSETAVLGGVRHSAGSWSPTLRFRPFGCMRPCGREAVGSGYRTPFAVLIASVGQLARGEEPTQIFARQPDRGGITRACMRWALCRSEAR